MADKYPNFDFLFRNETSGIDFRITVRRAKDGFAIVAPHGGGIEPGTSEIADAIAAEEFSFYAFEGLKRSGNSDLHITSTRFDEPMCLTVIGRSEIVLTIHGEESDSGANATVFVGGLAMNLGNRVTTALTAAGFDVRKHPDPQLQGLEPCNICNRGITGQGVQLELSRSLRRQMFSSLSAEGRKHPTPTFAAFTSGIRSVLEQEPTRAVRSAGEASF